MNGFVNFLSRISYTAYLFTLKTRFTEGAIRGTEVFLSKKDSMKITGERIDKSVAELKKNIDATASKIAGAAKQTPESFLKNPHTTQISLLQGSVDCKARVDSAKQSTAKLYDEYQSWNNDMIYIFVIKPSKIPSAKIKALAEAMGTDEKEMKDILKSGKMIDDLTYEEAAYLEYVFSNHGANCYFGLRKIDKHIQSLHDGYVCGDALKEAYCSAALWTRIIWSVLGLLFLMILPLSESPFVRYAVIPIIVAAVIFFALWGIQKLFSFIWIPITNLIVGKKMKDVEKLYEMALASYINEELDFFAPLSQKILNDIYGECTKLDNMEKALFNYVYAFFPKKLPISFVSFVAEQMMTGGSFSEGCWRAEQTMAQKQWQDEMRKKQEAFAKEEEAWRKKMLESQKRVEKNSEEAARAAQRATAELEDCNRNLRQASVDSRQASADYRELTKTIKRAMND